MTPYNRVKWVVVLCLSLFLWGCDSPPPGKSSQKAPRFIVGTSNTSLLPALFFIAANQQFFTAEGVEIEFKNYPAGRDALQAMLAGEVDLATTADTPIVFASFSRADYAVLATIADSANPARAIARKDSGIASIHDLKGKKVGVPRGTTTHYFMSEVLTHNLMTTKELTLVHGPPGQLMDKIIAGDLDALFIWEPLAGQVMNALAGNGISLPDNIHYSGTFNLVAPKTLIAAHGPELEKILGALLRAEVYAGDNRPGAVAAVADYLKQSPATITKAWDDYRFRLSLRQNLMLIFESQAQWVIKEKLVEGANIAPDYRDFFAPSALNKIKPESITLISR